MRPDRREPIDAPDPTRRAALRLLLGGIALCSTARVVSAGQFPNQPIPLDPPPTPPTPPPPTPPLPPPPHPPAVPQHSVRIPRPDVRAQAHGFLRPPFAPGRPGDEVVR